jgi:hypothetical protein
LVISIIKALNPVPCESKEHPGKKKRSFCKIYDHGEEKFMKVLIVDDEFVSRKKAQKIPANSMPE